MDDRFTSIAPTGDGFLGITAEGRLFTRIRDPKNFSGRDQERRVWREIEMPGKVKQAITTTSHSIVVLTREGRVFERMRDPTSASLTPAYVWMEHELPD